jgi:hypothetical protein
VIVLTATTRSTTGSSWHESSSAANSTRFFLADVFGVYDVYRGSPDAAIANAVQVPVNDPLPVTILPPAMPTSLKPRTPSGRSGQV